jgi:hypothetical protein
MGLAWSALVFLAYGAVPTLPAVIPIVAGLALAGAAYSLIAHWSRSPGWQDASRLALVFGGLIGSMLAGFLVFRLGGALPIDVIGKLVLNGISVGWLIRLAGPLAGRQTRT